MKLSGRDRDTLRALAATLLPAGGPLPSAESLDTAGAVAEAIERVPEPQRSRLVGLIRAVSALPWSGGRPRRLRNLSAPSRERLIGRLEAQHGYRALAFNALKQLIVTTWASHPQVTFALGDDGRCLADSEAGRAIAAPLMPLEGS